jgi:hypothetical protein
MKMVAHVTTGSPWPDGTPCPKGAVVLLCGEDSKDTIVSRLHLMGANCEQVSILEGIEVSREDEDPLLLRLSLTRALHVAEIESRVRETSARLVIVVCNAEGVVWDQQPVTVDAAQMLSGDGHGARGTEQGGKREQAERLLRAILSLGPQPQEYCLNVVLAAGISESTLKRAKKEATITSHEVTHPDGRRQWFWHLPDTPWSPDTQTRCNTNMAQGVRVSGAQPPTGEGTRSEEVEADPWDAEVRA